ncbi:c-type cytochrome [Mucilaginibacter ginsenosidivorans]|jgi:mono/diheme cytochrome c family protein|uniref:Cytochrome c n=1 Tax=Mucilaginibacter ginsenosidivorans TaxID=398053 RepID=A0A5B8UTW4_9SPHI|nr:cytochrome c [Mucilaginibacter ginsenosidivorans]QEC62369.1 cytochrome c [Mucilaginibacter ginsenosidivorans]HVW95958.1 cytochrome c [Mucilaginibacter sp.]
MKNLKTLLIATLVSGLTFLYACGPSNGGSDSENTSTAAPAATASADIDPAAKSDSKGIGRFTDVKLDAIDPAMADKGMVVFNAKCGACHKVTDQKVVGPGLKDVTKRRTPEWIMNQITNPVEMEAKDPVGQALLAKHLTQMTFQNVTDEETRQILEYFRKNDSK